MKRRRTYLAWMLLLVAVVIAVPRTWVHDCSPLGEAHGLHHDAGNHAEIDHAACPICDFAPAPSTTSIAMLPLLAPIFGQAGGKQLLDLHSYQPPSTADLRGPPLA